MRNNKPVKNFSKKGGLYTPKSNLPFENIIIIFLLIIFISSTVRCGRSRVNEADTADSVSKVHFVDAIGHNFLFRGALPLTSRYTFNYKGLKKAIQAAGKKVGVTVPDKFYLYDINLLKSEDSDDLKRIDAEYQFFKDRQDTGRIYVWGMRGTGIEVTCHAYDSNREFLACNLDRWLNDSLVKRTDSIRYWLINGFDNKTLPSQKTNIPLVIYMHCYGGCDRTGELSGAYYLRYLHKSWEEVYNINKAICGRPFGCGNYRAVQWYCLYLNLEKGFKLNWNKKFNCSGSDSTGCISAP